MVSIDEELAAKRKEGKAPLGLVPLAAIENIARVMEWGATKPAHTMHGWRKGLPYMERLDSALRHIHAFIEGEDNDDESGLCHLAHAMTQLSFVLEYMQTHPECDDRYKGAIDESRRTHHRVEGKGAELASDSKPAGNNGSGGPVPIQQAPDSKPKPV